jgi:hypothetical protein
MNTKKRRKKKPHDKECVCVCHIYTTQNDVYIRNNTEENNKFVLPLSQRREKKILRSTQSLINHHRAQICVNR